MYLLLNIVKLGNGRVAVANCLSTKMTSGIIANKLFIASCFELSRVFLKTFNL